MDTDTIVGFIIFGVILIGVYSYGYQRGCRVTNERRDYAPD